MINDENHCRDCCCARSWKALGVTEYDGRSIPEHIETLKGNYVIGATTILQQKARIATLEATLRKFRNAAIDDGWLLRRDKIELMDSTRFPLENREKQP